MDTEQISDIFNYLQNKIAVHKGLSVFAKERSKFEGWLKVELTNYFAENGYSVIPEKEHIDIVVNNRIAIELKTVNTSYKGNESELKNKTRPITLNIEEIIKDIRSLKNNSYSEKYVLFIVFPLDLKKHESKWNIHLIKINDKLPNKKLESQEIEFENKLKGVIYIGDCSK